MLYMYYAPLLIDKSDKLFHFVSDSASKTIILIFYCIYYKYHEPMITLIEGLYQFVQLKNIIIPKSSKGKLLNEVYIR